ncbi:MAG: hypothetical protein GEV28_03075 [Actinophytocola sp.]|nr:hypothetical protein [Actinophytocola sp.]
MARDIEAALRELGTRLDVPSPPSGLAAAVLDRLDEPASAPRLLPKLVAAAVALLVALAVAMTVSPTVRAAVLDFFRIGGVEVHYEPPPVRPSTSDATQPGEHAVTLEEARAAVRFDIKVPARLGEPEAVRVIDNYPLDGTPPRVVSLHWQGARVDELDGRISPVFEKFLGAEDVVRTTVDGNAGVWIPRPHPVLYVDRSGTVHEESARLSAKTLIWEADGVTYRVEGDFTREEAVAIAESMR